MTTTIGIPDTDMVAAAISLDRVTMEFQGLRALQAVTMTVERGRATALIGPNGSGKTTLLNVISGIYRPVTGTVLVRGATATRMRPHRRARLGIARTFQHVEMPKEMTVLDVVMLGRHVHDRSWLPSYLVGVPYWRHSERRQIEAARQALEFVGIGHLVARQLGELPYGLAKRVDLARALASQPSTLLLDEPAAGLNDVERPQLVEVLKRLRDERSLALVVVEHDMSFVASLCQHAVVLVSGEKIFDGPVEEMQQNALVRRALTGIDTPLAEGDDRKKTSSKQDL